MDRAGKKTAAAIHQEIAREVNQLLCRIFAQRRPEGRTDLEAVETALRTGLYQAGASGLSELLPYDALPADQRRLPCSCGQLAQYRELRPKPVLTVVGTVRVARPYYLCSHCQQGPFPADVELDIENTEFSPGVRRMQAMVGQEAPFDHGRQQMKLLAGLEVTAKSAERNAEAIGEDIARGERQEIQQAVQWNLPVVVGEPIPVRYVQMDGTGVPRVKKETRGRKGKTDGQPAHAREVKLGCVFTQTAWDQEGYPIRDRDRRRVWPAPLSGSLEAWLESRGEEGRHRRRGRMDLESGRATFSRRGPNRRSLACSRAPLGVG